MTRSIDGYDIAVSFAGAQRALVEPVVRACQQLGVKVFYDRDSAVELWGRNLIYDMRAIYGGARARYFVPFLSREYLTSAYPRDEYDTAMRRAIEIRDDSYLLPILVGSVEVPPDLLNPAIVYLRLEEHSVNELAQIIAKRVGVAGPDVQPPHPVPTPAIEQPPVRLPRLSPVGFNALETLESALARVGELFRQAADRLIPLGVRCLVLLPEAAVEVRIERHGQAVCDLQLSLDHASHEERLLMSFGWPLVTSDSLSGWVTAKWDPGANRPRLHFTDFGKAEYTVTADELFRLLWDKIVDHLERLR